jgi:hypothetical protein
VVAGWQAADLQQLQAECLELVDHPVQGALVEQRADKQGVLTTSALEKGATSANTAVFPRSRRRRSLACIDETEEIMGPLGMTARTFRDPAGSNRVGLIVETPSVEAWQEVLEGEVGAERVKHDGVRPETIIGLVEG